MDKDARNAIERFTQAARRLLESDFVSQLEGHFDIHLDRAIATLAGSHLSTRQVYQRDQIVEAIEHKRAAGMTAGAAAKDYLRDAAFTTLNRFVALKMLEARKLVLECVSKGEQSAGYREFCGLAPGLSLLSSSQGYRLYIESIFDELSTEVKVLFDRRDPSSVLWPKRATFERLLEMLNSVELSRVWAEDETIGWVYQFFNDPIERKKMREGGQPPRNSRELAVRNQFFTPRYVVKFLVDNTLGRIWYEMRGGGTELPNVCEYLVRQPGEKLAERAKKDPRDLRVLDPACGSGHFLLYAFDLLVTVYTESYEDPSSPRSLVTGRTLREDYPSLEALHRDVPALILAHNLHGVDIDSRCVQIAQLALWMRAQKAYLTLDVPPSTRPQIRRSNIVAAEPLTGDEELALEFVRTLEDPQLGEMFMGLKHSSTLAGELGLLLRLEDTVKQDVQPGETMLLSSTNEALFRQAITSFGVLQERRQSTRRKLFVDDTAQGIALLEIAELRFDVLLMNPPFGDATPASRDYLARFYPTARLDLYACFVVSSLSRCATGGKIGVLSSRLGLFLGTLEKWREDVFLGNQGYLHLLVDLGHNVLDDALVEAAAYVIAADKVEPTAVWACGLLKAADKEASLQREVVTPAPSWRKNLLPVTRGLPSKPLPYWLPSPVLDHLSFPGRLSDLGSRALVGIQTDDDFRFLRLAWELSSVPGQSAGWRPFAKGGEYSPYYDDIHLIINWANEARELRAFIEKRYSWTKNARSVNRYGEAGLTYPERTTSEFSPRPLPFGSIFSIAGPSILSKCSEDSFALLALFYTRWCRLLIEAYVGGGDAVKAGSAARHYKTGIINVLPFPQSSDELWMSLSRIGKACSLTRAAEFCSDETSRLFEGFASPAPTWHEYAEQQLIKFEDGLVIREKLSAEAEELTAILFGLKEAELLYIEEEYGSHPYSKQDGIACDVVDALNMEYGELCKKLVQTCGYSRQLTKLSHWTEKNYEAVAHLQGVSVRQVVEARRREARLPLWWSADRATKLLSYWVGISFGRWTSKDVLLGSLSADHLLRLPNEPFACGTARARELLVDDEGHPDDLCSALVILSGSGEFLDDLLEATGTKCKDLRGYIRRFFFESHLAQYSKSRRKAPVYWQLSTASGSYSVWLNAHAVTRDTLFRVQNDYVTQKLAHEERRLELMTMEFGGDLNAARRKELDLQQTFVDELRTFLEEIKRVAPLWNPSLVDGVVIAIAPLWRLMPQNKIWQKHVKATWDELCLGEYDWAHLALHLWPERVIPKCAEDRSLAIAHDLEETFWVTNEAGKWIARKTPTRELDEVVRERTSAAVKAALKGLLDAPAVTGGAARGGRKKAITQGGA